MASPYKSGRTFTSQECIDAGWRWSAPTEDSRLLDVTCLQCQDPIVKEIYRQPGTPDVPVSGTTALVRREAKGQFDYPGVMFCSCGIDHPGQPADFIKGCGAKYINLWDLPKVGL